MGDNLLFTEAKKAPLTHYISTYYTKTTSNIDGMSEPTSIANQPRK